MKLFERCNPVPVFLYFAAVSVFCAVLNSPFYTAVSFVCSLTVFIMIRGKVRAFLLFFAAAAFSAILNPLISKKGDTPLIFIGNSPVTLESTLYGINSAFVLLSILLFFYSFSRLISSQKLLYLMSPLSGAAALTVSMALRFAPMYARQAKIISDQQKALGESGGGTIPEKTRSFLRIFSALSTWALENGVVISDSMAARGYGVCRRKFYTFFKFRYEDVIMTVLLSALTAAAAAALVGGGCTASFYPVFTPPQNGVTCAVCRVSFTLLAVLPVAAELSDRLKWKCLISKI